MSQLVTVSVFLIRRLHVELRVVVRSTGLVKIEPYQCKEENIRLWSGIANTQTVLAQSKLSSSDSKNHLDVLQTVFRQSGWDVEEVEERKEVSL
jgi:hypothetical protein